MTVLSIAEIPGMTQEHYDDLMVRMNSDQSQPAGGLLHAAGPTETGWRVVEIWPSREAAERYLREVVAPLLPPDAPIPRMHYMELHRVVGLDVGGPPSS